MTEIALGIIDAQRGFMPPDVYDKEGFGELAVPDGNAIITPLNRLVHAFGSTAGRHIFTTQDYHPRHTAHFSETPDFRTNWPVHCVAGTPGAALHPDLKLTADTVRFIKGTTPLQPGEVDTSYSGYYAADIEHGESLPAWLERHGITRVVLGGLALDYCVGQTALDLRQKAGLEVGVLRYPRRHPGVEHCHAGSACRSRYYPY